MALPKVSAVSQSLRTPLWGNSNLAEGNNVEKNLAKCFLSIGPRDSDASVLKYKKREIHLEIIIIFISTKNMVESAHTISIEKMKINNSF